MRTETIGDAVLYLGDCLEILPTLGKVDAVVTDPPYVVSGGYGGGAFGNRAYLQGLKKHTINEGFDLSVFDNQNNIISFCSKSQVSDYIQFAQERSLKWDILVWHKSNPTPLCFERYLPDIEFIFHIRAKGVRVHGSYANKSRVISHPARQSDYEHPTVKPIAVISTLLASCSMLAQTIVDPFMGSGGTGVACANLGRKFIGIEIEEKYFDIACERIEAAYSQRRLFSEEPTPALPEAVQLPGI